MFVKLIYAKNRWIIKYVIVLIQPMFDLVF